MVLVYKKFLIPVLCMAVALLVFGAVLEIAQAQTSSCTISRTLYRGLSGVDVTCLQQTLVSLGLLAPQSATGFFGPLTEAAVQIFQSSKSIVSGGTPATTGYGMVGPRTRAVLGGNTSSNVVPPSLTPSPFVCDISRTLYRSLSGADVTCLQQTLVSLGFLSAESATGFFGPLTEAAVQKFQASVGLVTGGSPFTTGYGVVGPKTKAALSVLVSTPQLPDPEDDDSNDDDENDDDEDGEHSCSLDGVRLSHGRSRTFFKSSSVPAGQSCESIAQTRHCDDGDLSGSDEYAEASCRVAANPNAKLKVGTLEFGKTATNEHTPIITHLAGREFTSPVTDTMDLASGKRKVRLGFSDQGGGYINYVALSGFGKPEIESTTTKDGSVIPLNIDDDGIGKGWQSATFSAQHNYHYNPTQAGSHDLVGAPVTLVKSSDGTQMKVSQFNVPLFWEETYDYTEHEDVWRDRFANDGASTDVDLLDEPGITQSDEVRSEFDYAGTYLDRSKAFGLPAFMHDFSYAYIREPKAILQFTNPTVRGVGDNGLVMRPRRKADDVSKEEVGIQSLYDYDVSPFVISWDVRVPQIFKAFMWKSNGVWQSVAYDPDQERPSSACYTTTGNTPFSITDGNPLNTQTMNGAVQCPGAKNLRVVSTGTNPDTDVAIGVYYPTELPSNTAQTWIVDKNTMQLIGRQDRRAFSFLRGTFKGSNDLRPSGDVFDEKGKLNMGTQTVLSGLRSPTTLAAEGYPHAFELYFQRTYVLFGTPNQIYSAVEKFERDNSGE